MKRDKITNCALCDKGLMHDRSPMFYSVRIDRYVWDLNAVQQQAGLEMMLGNAGLAQVMGPDADLAKKFEANNERLICMSCAMEKKIHTIGILGERLYREEE